MNSAVEGIHHDALKHSRRAARLWKESAAIFNGEGGIPLSKDQLIQKASELNERAMDECMQALRSIEFLRRYRQAES
jgi:hypothetical protein